MAVPGPVAGLPVLTQPGGSRHTMAGRRLAYALAAAVMPMMAFPAAAIAQSSAAACLATADSMPGIPPGISDFGVSDVTVN